MKQLIFCVLIACSIGELLGEKRRNAYRVLNKKVNLLKSSFQRELEELKNSFHREMGELKYEVLDLRSELHLEKSKSARLEKLQNGTEDIVERGSSNDWNDMQIAVETVNELQKDILELKQVKKSLVKVEEGMRENKLGIEQLNERANKLSHELLESNRSMAEAPCKEFLILQKAFHDEKKRANQFESSVLEKLAAPSDALVSLSSDVATIQDQLTSMTKEMNQFESSVMEKLAAPSDALVALSSDVATIHDELTSLTKEMKEHSDVVADVQQKALRVSNETGVLSGEITEMKSEMQLVKEKGNHNTEQLGDISNELKHQESMISDNTESTEHIKARVDFLESVNLIAQEMEKKKKELQKMREDCLHIIRNGGPRMKHLMYVGMAVKWLEYPRLNLKISSLERPFCQHVVVSDDWRTGDTTGMYVWDSCNSLRIVEDEFDFTMCDKLRRN